MVWMSTLAPWHFYQKIHRIFPHSLATHLAGVWLAGFRPLRLQGISDQGWPANEIGTFTEQKATLCDPPHPPGDNAWGPPMVAAGSQASGLSAPTLLDGAPTAFSSTAKALSPAGRQKSFASNSTPFWKIQTYIYILVVLSLILVLVALFWHCLVVVVVVVIFCRLVVHFYFTRNNDTCKTVSGQTHIDILHVTIDVHL